VETNLETLTVVRRQRSERLRVPVVRVVRGGRAAAVVVVSRDHHAVVSVDGRRGQLGGVHVVVHAVEAVVAVALVAVDVDGGAVVDVLLVVQTAVLVTVVGDRRKA